MPSASYRILLCNVGYCSGVEGSIRDYLLHWYRYLVEPRRVFRRVLRSMEHLLSEEKPDLCCFVEVHRDRRFIRALHGYPYFDIENKYGAHGVLRHLPWLRACCNGVFLRQQLPLRKRFFRHGRKRLLYEVKLPCGASLFLVHLSLSRHARRAQIEEIRRMVQQRSRVILCGDFNTFRGEEELEELMQTAGLRLANPPNDPTFPASHPQKTLDMFLCSPGIRIREAKVVHGVHVSDHLPVLLEVEM